MGVTIFYVLHLVKQFTHTYGIQCIMARASLPIPFSLSPVAKPLFPFLPAPHFIIARFNTTINTLYTDSL